MLTGLQPAHLGIVFLALCLLITAAILGGRALIRALRHRKDQP